MYQNAVECNKEAKKCVLMAENEMQMEVLFTPLCIRDRLDPEKT